MGNVFAFVTATATKWTGEGSDDYTEEHGWVDVSWSRTELWESRNDVQPLMSCSVDSPDLADEVRDAFDSAPGGPFEDNGDGTYYGQTSHLDLETGIDYSYALHFVHKFHGPRGWTEEAWTPVEVTA